MVSLMGEKIADTCKTYLTSTSWKHVLSVVLLLNQDNFKQSISYNLKIENLKTEL